MTTREQYPKTLRPLERFVRSFANHRRIQILRLLEQRPELSVSEICGILRVNMKTASEHIRRLAIAGLVLKRSESTLIRHKLTPLAERVLKFLRTVD